MSPEDSLVKGEPLRRWAVTTMIVLIFLAIVKDWALSSVQPYPYGQSILATIAFTLPLIVKPRAWKIDVVSLLVGFGLLTWTAGEPLRAVVLLGCFAVPQIVRPEVSSLRWPALGLLSLCVAFAWRNQEVTFALYVGCMVAALGSFGKGDRAHNLRLLLAVWLSVAGWVTSLWPSGTSWVTQDLIGRGLGFSIHPGSLPQILSGDLGTVSFATFLLCPPLLAFAALFCEPTRFRPLAGAVGTLASLAVLGREAPSMLAIDSRQAGGSIAFGITLVALRHACSSGVDDLPRWKVDRSKIVFSITSLGSVACVSLFVGWLLAKNSVTRYLAEPVPRGYVRLHEVADCFQDATLAMEDGRFYEHGAFDYTALHRALRRNARAGRVSQGGSSLTQQLAKNAFLEKDRTFGRKVKEAFLAIELERQATKREILERYINTIDYGHGCRGIGQAAWRYFQKSPRDLTLAESALLVGLVPYAPVKSTSRASAERSLFTALTRVGYFFPDRYPKERIDNAMKLPKTGFVVGDAN